MREGKRCFFNVEKRMRRQLIFVWTILMLVFAFPLSAQTFVEIGQKYPVTTDGDKCAVNGFTPFNGMSDEKIFANAMLWAIENLCPQLRDGMTEVDIPGKSFSCDFTMGSLPDSEEENLFYVKATFRVADGKLLYYISDVLIESSVFVMKKVTPLEKLNPEKKAAHKRTMDDFIASESQLLNKMFDFIMTHQPAPITHWNDIAIRRAVKGMNEDECLMAFGKPQTIRENNGEVQWMYSSSFFLFFQNGVVKTVLR